MDSRIRQSLGQPVYSVPLAGSAARIELRDQGNVMSKTETYMLCVNLSASQTRKRLKGHGFGVRKVQAADRNQAVIVHTATREHLLDLKALFADVMLPQPNEDSGSFGEEN